MSVDTTIDAAAPSPRASMLRSFRAWLPSALLLAALADLALAPPWRSPIGPVLWVDNVALLGAAVYAFSLVRARSRKEYATPLDRILFAMFAVAAFALFRVEQREDSLHWLRGVLRGGLVFYAMVGATRRGIPPGQIWRMFGFAAFALGLYTVWSATRGLGHLAASLNAADVAWDAEHGVLNALLVATPVSIGMCLESDASPRWRVAAACGVLGIGLQLAATGLTPPAQVMLRMNDPLHFSNLILLLVAMLSLTRLIWQVGSEHRPHHARWVALSLTFAAFAASRLFAEVTSGAGGQMLGAIGAGYAVGILGVGERRTVSIPQESKAAAVEAPAAAAGDPAPAPAATADETQRAA